MAFVAALAKTVAVVVLGPETAFGRVAAAAVQLALANVCPPTMAAVLAHSALPTACEQMGWAMAVAPATVLEILAEQPCHILPHAHAFAAAVRAHQRRAVAATPKIVLVRWATTARAHRGAPILVYFR